MTRPLAWFLTVDPPHQPERFANHLRSAEMARALGRCGFRVEVIAPAGTASAVLDGIEYRQHPTAPSIRGAPPGWEPLWFMARGVPWLRRLAREQRPTWVFTNTAAYAPLVRRLKSRDGGGPFVHVDVMGLASVEGDERRGLRGWTARRIHEHFERTLLEVADLITTVNASHATMIARRFSPIASPIVVRDAADPVDRDRLAKVDLGTLGIPRGARLCFLGQLIHRRLDDLLAALERVPPTSSVHALVIGDGPDRAHYELRVEASDRLRGRVLFLGFRERAEALALVAASDIAFSDCWSSAGFPFKLFEYMALGRAIVVEGKEQMREVLRDGEHARFYRSVDDLAHAITALAANERERRRLGAAARALFESGHTLAHRRRELEAVIARHAAPAADVRRRTA
jgi:glycosyltransferase involved in cell wall biosynthesis